MAIDYPSFLPTPQRSTISQAEARQLSDPRLPMFARAMSTENRQFESLQWPAMSSADHEALMAWWKDDLVYGGAWFNATWPLPRGRVAAVRQFVKAPERVYLGRGIWRTTAVCEVRGLSVPVQDGRSAYSSAIIAWFDPIEDPITGTLIHSNNGSGPCDSFATGAVVALNAGMADWFGETIVWSLIWDSEEDASPIITGSFDNYVQIGWVAVDGSTFPVSPASIGTLIVTATIDGKPIAPGQRLIAVTSPPVIDYPGIAWGPE